MSVQDLPHRPLHVEVIPGPECTMLEPPEPSSLATQPTISPSRMVEPPEPSSLATQPTISPSRMVEPPASGASFLSLVPELRNEVYRYLLTLPDDFIFLRRPWESSTFHTSILYTNRQLSQEAAAIFYGENRFVALLDYQQDFFRVDKAEDSVAKRAVGSQSGVTQKKGDSATSSTLLTGFIYPHVFSRIRYLEIDIMFSCCSRRFKTDPWDFYPDWVAASLKTAVDALMPGSALRQLFVGFESLDMGKEVPTRAEVRVALEPLRALRGVPNVWIAGIGMGWDELFVAKLIWDMMEPVDGEALLGDGGSCPRCRFLQ